MGVSESMNWWGFRCVEGWYGWVVVCGWTEHGRRTFFCPISKCVVYWRIYCVQMCLEYSLLWRQVNMHWNGEIPILQSCRDGDVWSMWSTAASPTPSASSSPSEASPASGSRPSVRWVSHGFVYSDGLGRFSHWNLLSVPFFQGYLTPKLNICIPLLVSNCLARFSEVGSGTNENWPHFCIQEKIIIEVSSQVPTRPEQQRQYLPQSFL